MIRAFIAMICLQLSTHAQISIYSNTPGAGWTPVTDIIDENGNPIGDTVSSDGPQAGIFHFLMGSGAWVGYSRSPLIPLDRIEYWALGPSTPDPSFGINILGGAIISLEAEWAGYAPDNIVGFRTLTNPGTAIELFAGADTAGATTVIPSGTVYMYLTSPSGTFDSEFGGTLQNVFVARDRNNPGVMYLGFEDLWDSRRDGDQQDFVARLEHVPEPSTYGATGFLIIVGGLWVARRRG